jgi:hypothetical protein
MVMEDGGRYERSWAEVSMGRDVAAFPRASQVLAFRSMAEWRTQIRAVVWGLLAICFLIDGAVGELVVQGRFSSCIIYFDEKGRILPDPPMRAIDYLFVLVFLLIQAGLFYSLIRLRRPKPMVRLNLLVP